MQAVAFEVADGFALQVDVVQVAAAVIQVVQPSAVRQFGAAAVAVAVVVVADALCLRQVQHVVLRFAPVAPGQAGGGALFRVGHRPAVLGNQFAGRVVVEGADVSFGSGADQVAVAVVVVDALLLPTVAVAGDGTCQPPQDVAFEFGAALRALLFGDGRRPP